MDRKQVLLLLLLQMWRLQTMYYACSMIVLRILKRRRRGAETLALNKKGKKKRTEEDKLISDISVAIVESGKIMKQVADSIVKDNEDRSDIRSEIKKMGLPIMEQIEAMRIIMDKPKTISLFMSMDDEMRQVFVANLLAEQNPLRGHSVST